MVGTTPVLSAKYFSFFFFAQVIYSSVRIVQLTGEIYGLISWHHLWETVIV